MFGRLGVSGVTIVVLILALILLVRYRGWGRDIWPRGGPFSH
jgi:hypothetical protein